MRSGHESSNFRAVAKGSEEGGPHFYLLGVGASRYVHCSARMWLDM